ncbi:MAG: hypothetical protein ACRCX8_03155 [Sarcina sp.]
MNANETINVADILSNKKNELIKNATTIDDSIYENSIKHLFNEFKYGHSIKIGNDNFVPFGKPSIEYRAFDTASNVLTPQLSSLTFGAIDGSGFLSLSESLNPNIKSHEDIYNYFMNSNISIGGALDEDTLDKYYDGLNLSKKNKTLNRMNSHPDLPDASIINDLKNNTTPVINAPIEKKRRTGTHQDGTLIGAGTKEDLKTSN